MKRVVNSSVLPKKHPHQRHIWERIGQPCQLRDFPLGLWVRYQRAHQQSNWGILLKCGLCPAREIQELAPDDPLLQGLKGAAD